MKYNEFFSKNVISINNYNKSHIKLGLHHLSRKYIFGKTKRGSGGEIDITHQENEQKFKSF